MKKILLTLSFCVVFTDIVMAGWIIDRDNEVPYIRQNDYKDFGLSSCAPTSTAMILKYNFPNAYISSGQIYHAGTQQYYYDGPMKYYKNISFQSCTISGTGICINDTGKDIIAQNGKQYFYGNNSGTVFSNMISYLENSWRATVTTVTQDYSHIEEALRDTPLIANVYVCGKKYCSNGSICNNGHYLVIHNIDDNGTPNNTNDDFFIVNDPEPNCTIYKQLRNGKDKKIGVNTFLHTWIKSSIYKVTFPNTNNRILVEPSHSNIDGYPNGTDLEKYETYDYTNYTDTFDSSKTTFESVGHLMEVEDENTDDIWYYSKGGKSLVYLKKDSSNENITQVTWKPKLFEEGTYKIEYTTLDYGAIGDLTFELVGQDDIKKKDIKVSYSNKNTFIKKTLFSSVNIEDGDYIRVKGIPQDMNLGSVLFVKVTNSLNNTYLSEEELKNGLNCSESIKLTNGAFYCETSITNSDGKIDKFKLIIADRKRPYRLRPIIQFDEEATKSKKLGRFKGNSVYEHIKNRKSSRIIGAINGDSFGVDSHFFGINKLPDYSSPSFPLKRFIYGGININETQQPEAVLSFSSETNHIGIKTSFNNIGKVREGDSFLSVFYNGFFAKDLTAKHSFIEQGGKLNNNKIAKSIEKNSYVNWSIGLTQGSILGGIYAKKNTGKYMYVDKSDSKNIQNDTTIYGTDITPRLWYENTCYLPNEAAEDGGDYIPFISFNEQKVILGVSENKIEKNKYVCNFLRNLKMDYGAYLDGGGSTQLVVRNPVNYQYTDKSPNDNDRKVLSAIALMENYSDVDSLSEEYKRAIYYLTDFGVFSGKDDGTFGVGSFITRAEFSKMIINLLEIMQKDIEDGDLSKYIDVDDVDWFRPYAKKVVGMGLMEGEIVGLNQEKKKLSPNRNITYWELSKMISVAFQGTKNLKLPEDGNWVQKYTECLNNYGKGYSNRFEEKYVNIFNNTLKAYYDPNQKLWFSKTATREDVALFLYRAFILWQDNKFDDVSKSCVEK